MVIMAKTFEQIVNDIDSHLEKSKKQYYSDFYIGITNDVNRRLFGEHNVPKDNSWWIYRQAVDKDTAQKVEEYYLNKGMQGDTGGGTEETLFVYCYAITSSTIE